MYQTEKQLKELGDKAPSDLKVTVENHISDLRTALNGNDTSVEELQRLTGELEQSVYKLTELMYQQTTAAGTEQTAPEPEPPVDSDTVEAEFK